MHTPQIVVGSVPGKGGKNLNAHSLEIIHHDFRIPLDIIVTNIIDNIFTFYFRFICSNFLIYPGNIDFVMPSRLAGSPETWSIADKNVYIWHFGHHFFSNCSDIISNKCRSASLVDSHSFDVGKSLETINNILFKHFFSAEYDVFFLHISCKGIFKLKIVVIADVTLSMPGIVGASNRTMAYMNDILHGCAYNMFCTTVSASSF
ncbi:hypothetical protein MSSAC_3356 [Methanosarcina siciliae C2J]|uniref:Uncharacterized protein n=2 Tax=Methanosarcina siciliae TaxID=38027 RepID=A0A0E3P728_9EURY|nr:hypothetical protein MSSIT_2925 [Methanosarcina siciliae T4/M]AKB37946.1 hypothetical protein MSSAC_3356 [Methanosarcina siciliae C2J]